MILSFDCLGLEVENLIFDLFSSESFLGINDSSFSVFFSKLFGSIDLKDYIDLLKEREFVFFLIFSWDFDLSLDNEISGLSLILSFSWDFDLSLERENSGLSWILIFSLDFDGKELSFILLKSSSELLKEKSTISFFLIFS